MKFLFWKKEKYSQIKLSMIIFLGWRNLRANRTRSILTIGGVALGIGIISFLLSMGFGVQNMIVQEVTDNNPRDILDINNGNLDNFVALSDDFMNKIKHVDGVRKVERMVNTGGKVTMGESKIDAVIYGANKSFLDLSRISYRRGEKEYKDNEANVIISRQLANLLGFDNAHESIGKMVKFDVISTKEIQSGLKEETTYEDNEAVIVGIEESSSSYFRIPYTYMSSVFGIDLAQIGKVLATDVDKISRIEHEIQHLGFMTESINQIIEEINSFFVVIRIVLIILGTIIMSISAMGMLNTLSVSLLQRTKEVGILKALGAKRKDIFKMFVFEAIIISVFGGLLGLVGGYGVGVGVNKLLIFFAQKQGVEISDFVYIPYFFVSALAAFILFLGLATGIMPAYRAAKIHALDALRYE